MLNFIYLASGQPSGERKENTGVLQTSQLDRQTLLYCVIKYTLVSSTYQINELLQHVYKDLYPTVSHATDLL